MIEITENSTEQASTSGRKLTGFLRWLGSITLAVSAISFMVQGLEEFVPGYRNWVICGFIVVLCSCGLVCGYLMKETRGARLFFSLATAFLTVQYTQIGTMIYQSMVPVSSDLQAILSWWQVDQMSNSMFILIVITSVTLTALVVPTGFSMLARTQYKFLTIGYLVGNSLLLLPSRDNLVMASAVIMLFTGLRVLTRRSLAQDPVLRTGEGLAGLAIMWIPLAIIAGRGLFYPDNWTMVSMLLGIAAVILLIDVRAVVDAPLSRYLAQLFGTLSAILGWLIAAQETLYRSPFLHGYELLWIMLPLAFVLHLVSYTADYHGSKYRLGAGIVACFASVGFLLDNPGTVASFVCILTGIALTCTGISNKEKFPLLSGAICILSGSLFNLKFALDFYQAFPWGSSAVLGLVVLLLASYIDSRERIIIQKTWKAYQELKNWA